MSEILTGGCQCGHVRYQIEIDDFDAYLCHCRMCQRATGGVAAAFKNLPKARRRWLTQPDWYQSSPIARRPFCGRCGTPLGFEYPDSENCDVTVGSLDEPGRFVPAAHFGAESLHEAWLDTRGLERTRSDDYAPLVERWSKAERAQK